MWQGQSPVLRRKVKGVKIYELWITKNKDRWKNLNWISDRMRLNYLNLKKQEKADYWTMLLDSTLNTHWK